MIGIMSQNIEIEEINISITKVESGIYMGLPDGGYRASMHEDIFDVLGSTIPEAIGNFMLRIKELYVECDPKMPMPYVKTINIVD